MSEMPIVHCEECHAPCAPKWTFCPTCGKRLVRLKLTPTGDAARDRLVEARINLRAGDKA